MTITPDKASELLVRTSPGPWSHTGMGALIDKNGNRLVADVDGNMYPGDDDLAAAAPDLAQTIAGMREKWAREARIVGDGEWAPLSWRRSRSEAELDNWPWHLPKGATVEYRLTRRLVGPVEVVE